MKFNEWIKSKLGTDKWVVARRSPRLMAKGYLVFLSPKLYREIEAEYIAETGDDWRKKKAS